MAGSFGWSALALLFLAACTQCNADAVAITRRTAMVGPGFLENAKSFEDAKAFLPGAPITKLAFSSTALGQSGLSVWYGSNWVAHGSPNQAAFAEVIKSPITSVEVQWVESTNNKLGYFACFTFSSAHESFQLGQRVASAKTASWSAPPGSYLGGFAGMATDTALNYIQFIFVKPLPPMVTAVGSSTPWYTTGYTSSSKAKYFDDSAKAVNFPPLSQISANIPSKMYWPSGLSFTYGGPYIGLGATYNLTAASVTGRIVRIQGSFVTVGGGKAGYWGHLTFSTAAGKAITFGTPIDQHIGRSRAFDFKIPKGQWLGAVKGWATDKQLLSISFVFFKSKLQA